MLNIEDLRAGIGDKEILRGVDLSDLPYQYYVQELPLRAKLPSRPRVLLKVGDQPLVLEYGAGKGLRVMLVAALPYGDPAENVDQPHLYDWPEWVKLYAYVVRYAAHDL